MQMKKRDGIEDTHGAGFGSSAPAKKGLAGFGCGRVGFRLIKTIIQTCQQFVLARLLFMLLNFFWIRVFLFFNKQPSHSKINDLRDNVIDRKPADTEIVGGHGDVVSF
jgi:hypothetical protein